MPAMSSLPPLLVTLLAGAIATAICARQAAVRRRWQEWQASSTDPVSASEVGTAVEPAWLAAWPVLVVSILLATIGLVPGTGDPRHGWIDLVWLIIPVSLAWLPRAPEQSPVEDSP